MATDKPTVAVVGAGITGLTTAFKLRQQGHEVFVYEACGRAGGQIRSVREDGYLVESGPHTLLGRDALPALVDELGLSDRTLAASKQANKRFLVRDGEPKPAPMGPGAFLKTDLFSPLAKLRLFAEPFVGAAEADEESLAEFVTRRLGREPLEFAVGPMVAGTFAGDASKLSAKHAFPALHAFEQEHGSLLGGLISKLVSRIKTPKDEREGRPELISFDGGSQVLTDELIDRLDGDIEFGAGVFGVEHKSNGRWLVRFEQAGKRRQKTVDAVVLTAPAHKLADVDLDVADTSASLAPLGDIYYAPISVLALGFRRQDVDHPLDGFGMLIPRDERRDILGTLFMSSLFEGRAPAGHVLLTSFIGGARQPELAGQDTDTLVDKTLADLDELLGVRGRPVFYEHIAWEHAVPQYNVGYGRFQDLMDRLEGGNSGLYFAGSFRDGIAVPDLITAAYDLADRISEHENVS